MSNQRDLHRELNLEFEEFLKLLRQNDTKTWTIFVGRLRKVTVPWLAQKIGALPRHALVTLDEFVLEIFANALAKYYSLFEKGEFKKYQDLQSLMFRVSELKMKEGFAQLKRDQMIYRPTSTYAFETATQKNLSPDETAKKERITFVQKKLKQLPENERKLLGRYYDGEKMVKIAKELNLPETAIRKRKQRALDKLKKLVKESMQLWFLL